MHDSAAPIAVFGFPYAGGNAYAYRPLEAHLAPAFSVQGIELPGRGRRVGEALVTSLESMADDAFAQVLPQIRQGRRYALLGHSMGAALAHLCLQRIAAAGLPLPALLCVSGYSAPEVITRKTRHLLPKQEFLEMLRELGGCPPEILRDQELVEYFEPILRADFQAVETWAPGAARPLPVDITVLHGRGDELSLAQAQGWKAHTTAGFKLHEFDGDHFFIQQHWAEIARLIKQRLELQVHGRANASAQVAESRGSAVRESV